MNRRYDWRLGKVRSVDTGGQVIYDTALSRFRLADDGEGTPYDPLLGVRVGTLLNSIDDQILSLLSDDKTVLWLNPKSEDGAVRSVDGKESIWWDMMKGSELRGEEQS